MIQTIKNAWKVPELRGKILFTVFALLIFRVGAAIPVPFIDTEMLKTYIESQSGSIFGLLNVMSGDAFAQATVFAMSIQPYINSSIIIQLLTVAIPALERLARDGGEEGRKKIASITRYTTVAIALLQVLDNPRQDVALLAALRSPLFDFPPDRLAALRTLGEGSVYDCLCAGAERGEQDCAQFLALLSELRLHCAGNIILVFGAGGDRPRLRRIDMGRAAAQWADYAILTADNPRRERVEDICADIAAAIGSPASYRLVGAAVRANPAAVLVPCHRVVGAGGRTPGAGRAARMREACLKLERRALAAE